MGLSSQPTLTPDEEALLGHYRRLKKHHRDFKLELFGSFKAGRRQVQVRPIPYLALPIDDLESVFEAID